MSKGLPVSRKLLRPESTSGQPLEMPPAISEPAQSCSWTTFRRTTSPIASISKVTRECSDLLPAFSGLAQLSTSRLWGRLSSTSPVMLTTSEPSLLTLFQLEPCFQSETLALPQYWLAISGVVMASHTFLGVLVM